MIKHFISFEWKQFFRSAFWQKGIAIKIIMLFFALYFLVSFLAIGIGAFYIIKEVFPEADPLQMVNSYLLFAIITDLIFRYLAQKIPVMNIKPMLSLPIKKSKLVHYVLGKSAFSFFNFISLFFYIPFAIVLLNEGYTTTGVLGWLFTMVLLVQSINFLNFLINKNNTAFWGLVTVLIAGFGLKYFNFFDTNAISQLIFDGVFANPILAVIPLGILIGLYILNFKQLRNQVYLDDAVSKKVEEANTADLSWTDRFGSVAPFLKNDIRLIWRNKRTKTVFLMSFAFVLYGLIFYPNPMYEEKMPTFLIFASIFVTGGFVLNYGQFIPAWESSFYRMLMTQNLRYRLFLESKWYLMVVITAVLYLLSIPYIYFGIDVFLMISAGAIFNIGFNSLFLLYAGSFNRKRIDLNKGGFTNTQGTGATQFLIMIPVMGIPMLLFWGFKTLISFNAGVIAIAVAGIIGLVFKNYFMNLIEKKYIKDKYKTIHAFNQKT